MNYACGLCGHVDEVPIAEGSNTYNLRPRSVKDIRHALFGKPANELPKAALAKRCLMRLIHCGTSTASPRTIRTILMFSRGSRGPRKRCRRAL
jgi:hypothetical protein